MRKNILLLFATVFMLFGSQALFAQGKYGRDSAECVKYLNYYKDYFKQKDFEKATPHWRNAFLLCPPTASVNMLADGEKIIKDLINKNSKNIIYKEALVDTLMMVYDLRAENYPKYKVSALNSKGQSIMQYMKNDNKKVFKYMTEIIAANQENASPYLFVYQLNAAVALYKDGLLSTEEVIEVYDNAVAIFDKMKPSDNLTKVRGDLENIFMTSNVASCDNLIDLFTPRFDAAPEDLALAKNVVKMLMVAQGCTNNDLFLRAATLVHTQEPTANSAYNLYRLNQSKGNFDEAVRYIKEAIASDETDDERDAQLYYELAVYYSKNGKQKEAMACAQNVVKLDSDGDVKGKAYVIIGTIWGTTRCSGNEIESRAPYWVAVDYMEKAKAADPSLAEECNRYIASYKVYFPQAAEAFMYGLVEGNTYKVSCGGMTAETRVRLQH